MNIAGRLLLDLAPEEREDFLRQAAAALSRLGNLVQGVRRLAGELLAVEHERGVSEDDGKQVVEMMGDAARERPYRMRPLGLNQLLGEFGGVKVIRDGLLQGAAKTSAERERALHLLLRQGGNRLGQLLGVGARHAGQPRDLVFPECEREVLGQRGDQRHHQGR